MKLKTYLAVLLVFWCLAAFSQAANPNHDASAYANRWRPTQYIMAQNGVAKIGVPPSPTHVSALWDFTDVVVNDTLSYITLHSKANFKMLLNIEKGKVELSEVPTSFWSAQWYLEYINDNGKVWWRIKNRWKGTYLNIEKGVLECTAVPAAFLSSHWEAISN
ncbi:MAG: hypothetical protein EAY75_08975 [Bacteroidetes bacterium]|nr:MAG: hypothetical protein EAY75_08975 [Bacteroidota bacterium]